MEFRGVCFNLAENRKDDDWPFAFLATYTTGLSTRGQAKHVPLAQALREYAGASNRASLLNLPPPVQDANERVAEAMRRGGASFCAPSVRLKTHK